jgi:glycosyltransferase involved in cell wall biosynthesis
MAKVYRHEYLPLSIYGNVVTLLRDQALQPGVHLDIGCGYGAIAEPIRNELGLTYVGFDIAEDGLESLRERGFEVHRIDLLDPEQAEANIREAIGDRRLASLTFMDTLEHITNGPAVLRMLRRIANRDAAPLVLSVPNVTHKDLALKLLIGRWDITEAGLLDHTHVGFYSQGGLSGLMASIGWRELAAHDWLLEHSDQEFPLSAPNLNPRLPIGHFLRRLIDQANPAAIVNQFVRLYRTDKPKPLQILHDRNEPPGPFLSIVIPAAVGQIDRLVPLLRSLAQQTEQDFEVMVVVHPCNKRIVKETLNTVLARLPASFRRRVTPISSPHDERLSALNTALSETLGRYVVIMDEGDLVESNWCATFAELAEHASGAVLRSGALSPVREQAAGDGHDATKKAVEVPFEHVLPLELNTSASIADFAMPAGLFHNLRLRLDLEIGAIATWDLVTQATLLCGLSVSSVRTVSLNIVRGIGTTGREGAPELNLLAKLNSYPLLLPVGSAERIHRISASAIALREENARVYEAYNTTNARLSAARSLLALPLLRDFVTSQVPDVVREISIPREPPADDRLFLSIITRTQGTRIRTLRDVLMCLAGQSCQDFELLIIVHSPTASAEAEVKALVAEFPLGQRERIRILTCTRAGRAAPLNDAVSQADGQYVAFLDDDDFVFGHWVETFRNLAREVPGAMLRAVCARQDFELPESDDLSWRPRATSWFRMDWPATYDAVPHLHANFTPFMSLAFPAEAFRSLGFRFDESLNTTEDWELSSRLAMLCGVTTAPDVTSVYRWWTNAESSAFLHGPKEWDANRQQILQKQNALPVLLPPGATGRINHLLDRQQGLASQVSELENVRAKLTQHVGELERVQAHLEERNAGLRDRVGELDRVRSHLAQRNDWMSNQLLLSGITIPWADASDDVRDFSYLILQQLLKSRSWRWTRPLRKLIQALRRRGGSGFRAEEIPSSFADCQRRIREVRQSTSWRLTWPLRAITGLLRR